MFGNDYRWRIVREPLDDPAGQVDEVSKDRDAGFSPGLAFATSLLNHNPEMVIGLIPCAKGSSSIGEWQRNLSENTLYGSCLKRIRAASIMGKIAGLFFFQGETDALDPNRFATRSLSASSYAKKFAIFIGDLRRDVSMPSLPVVFAQIGTNRAPDTYTQWHMVREQQKLSGLHCAAMITTDDLALSDEVHFTTESYRLIGERYSQAFRELTTPMPRCGLEKLGEMRGLP